MWWARTGACVAGQVVDEDPADGKDSLSGFVPESRSRNVLDPAFPAAVPTDGGAGSSGGSGDGLRFGQGPTVDRRTARGPGLAGSRGSKEIGLGMESADQADLPLVLVTEHGQFMGGVSAIADNDELPVGKPVNQAGDQLHGQPDGSLVPLGPLLALFASLGLLVFLRLAGLLRFFRLIQGG